MRGADVALIVTAVMLAACAGGSKHASTPTATPIAESISPPTAALPAPTDGTPTPWPTTQEDAVIEQTVRDCMRGLPDELSAASGALHACLNQGEAGFTIAAVPADVPVIVVERAGDPGLCRSDDFILWRDGGEWRLQFATALLPDPVDERLLGGATTLGGVSKQSPTDLVREATDDQTTLLSVLALTASCGSGPSMEVLLFALDGGTWRRAWDPRGSAMTTVTDASAEFADASGIGRIRVRGALWGTPGDIFHESHPGPHRYMDQSWELDGFRYTLTAASIRPSAYNTLVNFAYAISTGNDASATKLLADASLLETAKQLGLIQQPLGKQWLTNLEANTECCGPIHILSGPQWNGGPPQPVVVSFVQRGSDWLISSIEVDAATPPP